MFVVKTQPALKHGKPKVQHLVELLSLRKTELRNNSNIRDINVLVKKESSLYARKSFEITKILHQHGVLKLEEGRLVSLGLDAICRQGCSFTIFFVNSFKS